MVEAPAPVATSPTRSPDASSLSPRRSTDSPAGFESFFLNHRKALLGVAMRLGATRHEADECVASAMKDVLTRWDTIDEPFSWARRAVQTYLIRERTRGLEAQRLRLVERGAGVADVADDLCLTDLEDREWVAQILAELPPAQRQVMTLAYHGLTPSEISVLIGKNPDTVRQNLRLARAALRDCPDVRDRHRRTTSRKRSILKKRSENR